MMKKNIFICVAFFLIEILQAQSWTEMLQEPGRNFYEVKTAGNNYYNSIDLTKPGTGYKQFKRWEYFVERRVYPSGDLTLLSTNWKSYQNFLKESRTGNRSSSASAVGTWTAMGPLGAPSGSVFGTPTRTGRDNFITFDPTTPSTYWCGACSGGLWKTTNNGATWTTGTDNLGVIGCSDLAIDPTNTNIMYLATGDGEAAANFRASIGVLKSTDGGITWNATGLVYTESQQRQIRRLLINPSNPQILIAATTTGVFYTLNAGSTWSLGASGNFYDLEFKPGDPNIVYAASNTSLRLSTNGGASFVTVNTGIPTSGSDRMAVAVTPADPTYVYVLRSNSSTSGYGGVYRSTNSGSSFTVMSSTPDILNASCSASGTGGIGWYALAFAASPLNKDEIVVGSINVWQSLNGGTTWTNYGCQSATTSNPFVHADHHELEYTPGGVLYSAHDGGIVERTGSTWTDRTGQRNITEIYRIGLSAISPSLWITGHQDNGSNVFSNGSYNYTSGSDGLDCFIDRTNNSNMFCSAQNGGFKRSTNGGVSWSAFTSGMTGSANWLCPWKQDPVNANLYYAGYSQLFVSNGGGSWTQLTNTGGSGYIEEFAIAPSNNQVIYVIHGTSIRKTTDAGITWTNISSGIPGTAAAPSFITIDPTDENTAWVTCSGYSAANKVFKTTNGGLNWTNITGNLPNLPANCSVYQPATSDRIYVGMDIGVYTRDNSSSSWTLLNTGLPNVPVFDMEISPAAPNVLRAATFGRGVYETELVQPTTVPVSSFVVTGTVCSGVSKTFADVSSEAPTSWSWTVSPASGVTVSNPNSQNPSMTFPAGGIYTISMVASNGIGAGSVASNTVNVFASPALTLSAPVAGQTVCVDDNVILTASGALTYTWLPGPVINDTLSFVADLSNGGTYTVNGKSLEGCSATEKITILVSECTGINAQNLSTKAYEIFPNPANNFITIKSPNKNNEQIQLEVFDVAGKLVMDHNIHFKKEKAEQQVNISSLPNGVYLLKISYADGTEQQVKLVKE